MNGIIFTQRYTLIYKYQTFVEINKHIIKWNTFNAIYLWTGAGTIRASKDRFKLILPRQNMYLD